MVIYNSSLQLEETACPLCKSGEKITAYEFLPYKVEKCKSCNLYYLSPRLKEEDIHKFYASDSYFKEGEVGYTNYYEEETALRDSFRSFLLSLKKKRLTGGSLLEVGCGFGFLLEEAKSFFLYRAGIDFAPMAVQEAKKRADNVYMGDIKVIPAEQMFDCIILSSVIEHIYDPVTFLTELRAHLKEGGKMIVTTPAIDSAWSIIMARNWTTFQVIPEHVLFLGKKTLSKLMLAAKFTNIEVFSCPRSHSAKTLTREFKIFPNLFSRLGNCTIRIPFYNIAASGFYHRGN